ncbi:4-phosphoerythronate dehydrogenase PdxB [Halopseudomonas salina]|uniref:Erythronate-4-phosphate dehydrogenase n=1 Tax=Halopseudomonas salina TaxID=1323744 RepID=A0ABQ1P674_9GAMM|nr:4-phosphoerythronate dehydrogenase PdxB [Halopseudomonas salina]GGC89696.1 erythronate-4-phosphate dehydrogenase [Halopseudomonas salina]
MRIVADENIPLLDGFFASFGDIIRMPGRAIDRAAVSDADVLLVRSVTRVSAELLAGTPVRFVGTCTIGTDHLDLAGLAAAGVRVASAPGCNARGVVEYVLSCLLTLAERTGESWWGKTVGVVGVGEVGNRLITTLEALGVRCLRCDPPRADAGERGLIDIDQLLAEADVISCHVPLTSEGAYPTSHLFDEQRLQALKKGAWFINSSRGPVIDNLALARVLSQRPDLQVALDVWEYEPEVSPALAALCALATPHIAGYSLDGKLRGTAQIYAALCDFAGEPVAVRLEALAPNAGEATWQVNPEVCADWLLARALRWVYDVRDDDARMRHMLRTAADESQRRAGFDQLRKMYPLRRETGLLAFAGSDVLPVNVQNVLLAAGFTLS